MCAVVYPCACVFFCVCVCRLMAVRYWTNKASYISIFPDMEPGLVYNTGDACAVLCRVCLFSTP